MNSEFPDEQRISEGNASISEGNACITRFACYNLRRSFLKGGLT